MSGPRRIKWTVLAVGEGDAEVALLDHLKATYFSRACGATMKIQQAYGKGAGNVVDRAIACANDQDYDRCLALFDTDQGYTPEVVARAREHQLVTVPAEPCLEGLMLRLHGDTKARSSDQHKAEFARRFGGRVQDGRVLQTHFHLRALERARGCEPLLHRLINTFGIARRHAASQCRRVEEAPSDELRPL